MGDSTCDSWAVLGSAHGTRAGSDVALVRRFATYLLCMVLATLALPAGAGAADAGPGSPRALTVGALVAQIERLDAAASALGERLLRADVQRDALVARRDVARSAMATLLAEEYKRAVVDGGTMQGVLRAQSIGEAADAIRIAGIVAEHHRAVVRSLDRAELELDISVVERDRLIARLVRAQDRVSQLREEVDRRAAHRAAMREQRLAQERERAASTAEAGTLVSSVGSAADAALAAPAAGSVGASAPAALLDAYLARKGSPMAGQGAAFVASGQRWQVDPRLVVAIAGAESNFGQVTCGPNNAWGWSCPNDPADFLTWAAGIDTVTRGLRTYYLDEGRTSVELIHQKYCPVGAANDPTGLNASWGSNVTRFLLELGGNPSLVGPGPSVMPGIPGLGLVTGGD